MNRERELTDFLVFSCYLKHFGNANQQYATPFFCAVRCSVPWEKLLLSSRPADRQPVFSAARPSALFRPSPPNTPDYGSSLMDIDHSLSLSSVCQSNHLNPCFTSALWNINTYWHRPISRINASQRVRCSKLWRQRRSELWHRSNLRKPLRYFFAYSVIATQLQTELSLHVHGCGFSRRRIKVKCLINQATGGRRWRRKSSASRRKTIQFREREQVFTLVFTKASLWLF